MDSLFWDQYESNVRFWLPSAINPSVSFFQDGIVTDPHIYQQLKIRTMFILPEVNDTIGCKDCPMHEIGYLPIDKDSAHGFFQLVATRYEKRPIILTTNQPLSRWGDVFGDYTLANAIIDRLVHHSRIIKITGQSYRIKCKQLFDDSEQTS